MSLKKLHYISGIIITFFIGLHLFNHFMSIISIDQHIHTMNMLRSIYRNVFVESILILAVLTQIISGLKLFSKKRKWATKFFDKLQIYSGLYLAMFFIIHVGAVFVGRLVLELDTNFYFGVAGINTFPLNLFFIPYYALAIMAFFGHIASVHALKIKIKVLGLTPKKQGMVILILASIFTLVIFYGLTGHFKGVDIPHKYQLITNQ